MAFGSTDASINKQPHLILASGKLATDEKGGATYVYDYDDAGRMVEALNGTASLASYAYDAFEQRIEKDDGTDAVHYVYDLAGRLIAEQDGATGAALREYVYLGLMPAAYVDHSGANPATYYVHTDQVMRPRKLTDAAAAILWDRIATPFGDEHTVTGTLTQKLQFPGQIEETETEFFQNWHREYDPELGRYVQSDPIGLLGGINTYGYVGANPVMYVDPDGRDAIALGGAFSPGAQRLAAGASRFGNYGLAAAGAYLAGDAIGRAAAPYIAKGLVNAGLVDGFTMDANGNIVPAQSDLFDLPYTGPVGMCKAANDNNPPISTPAPPPGDGPQKCTRINPKEGIPLSSGARRCRYSCPDGSTRHRDDFFRGNTNVCAPSWVFQ